MFIIAIWRYKQTLSFIKRLGNLELTQLFLQYEEYIMITSKSETCDDCDVHDANDAWSFEFFDCKIR